MLISETLNLKEKAFISLVGAGGKSTIFSLLAQELDRQKKKIILTTTTHMFVWQLTPFTKNGKLIETDDEKVMEEKIKKYFQQDKNRVIVLIHHRVKEKTSEKVVGPNPDYLLKWWEKGLADYFLVEADGARGKPIKAPNSHEPVICKSTTNLIGIIGIDALNVSLAEKNVFRPHIFSHITGIKLGEKISLNGITTLINHPKGLFKNVPPHSKCHLFINKVDNQMRKKSAEKLATHVLHCNTGRINDIILSSTYRTSTPVIEIIKEKKEE